MLLHVSVQRLEFLILLVFSPHTLFFDIKLENTFLKKVSSQKKKKKSKSKVCYFYCTKKGKSVTADSHYKATPILSGHN